MEKDKPINRVQDLLRVIGESKLAEKRNAHVRVWFRGQPALGRELVPGVYREDFPQKDEAERLRIERHLAQDFRIECASVLSGSKGNADLYFLQQHYRLPTRLLDWTLSPLAALYFAVQQDKKEPDADGELFMMDAYRLSPCQSAQKEFEGVMTRRNPIFDNALHVIFDWWDPEENLPKHVLPVRPDQFDPRITLQKACFTFHTKGRERVTKDINDTLLTFRVPKDSKPDIKHELFLLGSDPFSIYGNLESLSERLRLAYGLS